MKNLKGTVKFFLINPFDFITPIITHSITLQKLLTPCFRWHTERRPWSYRHLPSRDVRLGDGYAVSLVVPRTECLLTRVAFYQVRLPVNIRAVANLQEVMSVKEIIWLYCIISYVWLFCHYVCERETFTFFASYFMSDYFEIVLLNADFPSFSYQLQFPPDLHNVLVCIY